MTVPVFATTYVGEPDVPAGPVYEPARRGIASRLYADLAVRSGGGKDAVDRPPAHPVSKLHR
jgi:hypothetical protein